MLFSYLHIYLTKDCCKQTKWWISHHFTSFFYCGFLNKNKAS